MRKEKIEEAPWFDLERSGLNMYNSSTVIWVLVAAFLVYFMQAGFALCEAGLTRAKNTGNILMKNMMDFCIGTPCFWLVGFGIMFAGSGPLIGGFAPFMSGDYSAILPEGVPLWVYAVFQTVFCATEMLSSTMSNEHIFSSSSICTSIPANLNNFIGIMVERTQLLSFVSHNLLKKNLRTTCCH